MPDPAAPRRDLVFFAAPVLLTLAATLAFHLDPWPVPIPAQAATFAWAVTLPILAAGMLGVGLSSRIGCPSAPPLGDGQRWAALLGVSCGLGFALGAEALFTSIWPPIAHQFDILARQSGFPAVMTWVNVGLPVSIPHYFAASVLLECVYRLAPIPILTWLISNLALKGRGQSATFWSVGVFAAAQEPLLWLLGIVRGPLPPATLAFAVFNAAETLAINLLEVLGLRRFGWPAAIAFRVAYYAAARVLLPYLLSPHSVNYPGPH